MIENFSQWLDTFVEEKGLDVEHRFEVTSDAGILHSIPLGCVIEQINASPSSIKQAIGTTLIIADYKNADVMDNFRNMALGIANAYDRMNGETSDEI